MIFSELGYLHYFNVYPGIHDFLIANKIETINVDFLIKSKGCGNKIFCLSGLSGRESLAFYFQGTCINHLTFLTQLRPGD